MGATYSPPGEIAPTLVAPPSLTVQMTGGNEPPGPVAVSWSVPPADTGGLAGVTVNGPITLKDWVEVAVPAADGRARCRQTTGGDVEDQEKTIPFCIGNRSTVKTSVSTAMILRTTAGRDDPTPARCAPTLPVTGEGEKGW